MPTYVVNNANGKMVTQRHVLGYTQRKQHISETEFPSKDKGGTAAQLKIRFTNTWIKQGND